MEKKYYKKPDTKTVQLKIERHLLDDSPATGTPGGGDSRELRSVWKDDEE